MDQTSYDNQDIQTWNNFDYANQPMDNPNQFIINTTFAEGTVPVRLTQTDMVRPKLVLMGDL